MNIPAFDSKSCVLCHPVRSSSSLPVEREAKKPRRASSHLIPHWVLCPDHPTYMYCTDWLVLVVYGRSPMSRRAGRTSGEHLPTHANCLLLPLPPFLTDWSRISPHHTAQHLRSRVEVCIFYQVTYRLSGLPFAYVWQVFPCMGAFGVHGIPPKLLVLLSNPGRQASLIPLSQEFWPLTNGFSNQETQLGNLWMGPRHSRKKEREREVFNYLILQY